MKLPRNVLWFFIVLVLLPVTVLAQSITVLTPNGGERWTVGGIGRITWEAAHIDTLILIKLNRNFGTSNEWVQIGAVGPDARVFEWQVSGSASELCRVMVSAGTGNAIIHDISNANFTIAGANVEPSVIVTRPNGGEVFAVGSQQQITWNANNVTNGFSIQLNRNYPNGEWVQIGEAASAARSFTWTVTGTSNTTAARIKVQTVIAATGEIIHDISNTNFSIQNNGGGQPAITVTRPNGGENFIIGSLMEVGWVAERVTTGAFLIELNRSYPQGEWIQIGAVGIDARSFGWTVTGQVTTTARIRVRSDSLAVNDISNANFRISEHAPTPTITVTCPNGGEVFVVGSTQEIVWNASNILTEFVIQLNRNYPDGEWSTIGQAVNGSHTFVWVTTEPNSMHARIRVRSLTNDSLMVEDISDANFTIGANSNQPFIRVVRPNGGELLRIGNIAEIGWVSEHLVGNVVIELNRHFTDSLGTWEFLGSVPNTAHLFYWTITGPVTTSARIRVRSDSLTLHDISDRNFGIAENVVTPSIVVNRPNGGERFTLGSMQEIAWLATGIQANVTIRLNRNYPDGEWSTITTLPAVPGVFRWQVSGQPTMHARIKVSTIIENTEVFDISNANFTIAAIDTTPAIFVTRPNGSERFFVGTPVQIRWECRNITGHVRIQLNRNYPDGEWMTLATRPAVPSSFTWIATSPASERCRIRVSLVTDNGVEIGDISNANFRIVSREEPDGFPPENQIGLPRIDALAIHPNPFNASTTIRYTLPEASPVLISLFDFTGRAITTIVREQQSAGQHTYSFNANQLASGVYILRFVSNQGVSMQKAVVVK